MPSSVRQLLDDTYGNPRTREGYEDFLEDRYRFPETPKEPRHVAERGDRWRAPNPAANEEAARELGDNAREGRTGSALGNLWDLILGTIPGVGARARGRTPGQPNRTKIPGYGEVEVGPIPQLETAKRNYAQSRGLPNQVPESIPAFDETRARRVAQAYDDMVHDPTNPDVRRVYDALANETVDQFKAARNQGIDMYFMKPGQDPYAASPALSYMDLKDRGRLFVFPTDEGFGSKIGLSDAQIAAHPMLRDSGMMLRVGGPHGEQRPANLTELFRGVHDLYGHNGPGNPFFRAPGEERAWIWHSAMYSPEARQAMSQGTRGQNSWVNYGPHGERNRNAATKDTIFAEQKAGLLPQWVVDEGMPQLTTQDMLDKLYGEKG